MNPHLQVMQTYPTDRFQEKSIAIVKAQEVYSLGNFNYLNFDFPKPQYNKIAKHVKDYINYVMSDFKDIKFNTVSVYPSVEVAGDLRPGISMLQIGQVRFSIKHKPNEKSHTYLYLAHPSVVSPNSEKIDEKIVTALEECIKHINVMLERGCMHACAQLYQTGLWFTDYELYSALLFWLRSANEQELEVNEEIAKDNINRIIKSEISSILSVEHRLTTYGSDTEAFPAYSPVIATQNHNEPKHSVFLPQHLGANGWGIELATTDDNIDEQYISELNLLSMGVNKLISKIRGSRL